MRKILLTLLLISFGLASYANDFNEVRQFFNNFISAGNNYESNYFDYYSPNPHIERIVIKKDGSRKVVVVPMSEFKKHSKLNLKIGKLRHYKNNYSNIKISQEGENYKLTAMRQPSTSAYKLPVEYLIGKDTSGQWKIKEESMHTKVQAFLKKGDKD